MRAAESVQASGGGVGRIGVDNLNGFPLKNLTSLRTLQVCQKRRVVLEKMNEQLIRCNLTGEMLSQRALQQFLARGKSQG